MNDTCIFCNEPIKKKLFCNHHSIIFLKQYNILLKSNISKKTIKGYYHNLRYSIMKSGSLEVVIELCIKLIALGYLNIKQTGNTVLLDKAIYESKSIYSNKVNFQKDITKNVDNFKSGMIDEINVREKWPTNFVCSDGHKVRSLGELFIDNWLFSHDYKHCYEKKIFYDKDKYFFSDFYLDKENIYLEYCGKKERDYLVKKAAQKKIYESLDLKIIYIDYDDLKTFDDFFEEKIRKVL